MRRAFTDAVKGVVDNAWDAYGPFNLERINVEAIKRAYTVTTNKYGKCSLRSYFTDVAVRSKDTLNLYDLGNAVVVIENGFSNSFKVAFLSSNDEGLKAGMDAVSDTSIST